MNTPDSMHVAIAATTVFRRQVVAWPVIVIASPRPEQVVEGDLYRQSAGQTFCEVCFLLRLRLPARLVPGIVSRRSVDRRNLRTHRSEVTRKLSPMMNSVEEEPKQHVAQRGFPNHLAVHLQP